MNKLQETDLVETFLPYMQDVTRRQAALHELHQTWRLIEASAKMNCPVEARLLLPAVLATRTDLVQLERDLVANMVSEKVRQVMQEAATRAQYALDLLVRNLFERTADVGFLAADLDLCRYLGRHAAGQAAQADADAVRRRLLAYRAKYTVYDDILLLAPDGRVAVQADAQAAVAHSSDPLVAATLAAPGYLETFRASDLRPGQARALLYSQAMRDPDSGAVVGVLCLSFRFEHELAAIFQAYGAADMRANMLLLDADNQVVSSADPLWIAPGVRVPVNLESTPASRMFAGREYLVATSVSQGYQGYPGPAGWKVQVMAPLDLAFRGVRPDAAAQLAPRMLQGLLSHAHRFSPALHVLMSSVLGATQAIKRIVWNGKVTSSGAANDNGRLNPVLDQITETGERSDEAFSQSIQGLYQTVLASSLQAAGFTAQLLVDMLDRSLYERANDCRWWALAGQLRQALADGDTPQRAETIASLLAYINGLYTVYSRLFVYDRSGCILAATGSQDVVGSRIAPDTLSAVCGLRSEMDHYPEPFGPSPLYEGRPTFVYHAAIRHPERENTVVGGIGIVFDSAVELSNMLASGVAGRAGMQAFLVSPDGRILCGTDPAWPAGEVLPLERALLDEAATHGAASRIVAHGGQYCVAACARAGGYREFRSGAHREQPVLSVLLQSFGQLADDAALAAMAGLERVRTEHEHGRDYALFQVDGDLMALPADAVIEALPFAQVKRTPPTDSARIGMLDVDVEDGRRHFVWVFDLARLVSNRPHTPRADGQVILVRDGATTVGLLVDDVHSVQRFDPAASTAIGLAGDEHALSSSLIKANGGALLIQELSAQRLVARACGKDDLAA